MEKIIKHTIDITIAGKNVTTDIGKYLSSITYTDRIDEHSDDISLTFEDTKALWQSSWFPSQGDPMQVKFGMLRNLLNCGQFEIDEVELETSPDTVTVKAIAAPITQAIRTKNSKAFEKQTLREIAQYFADKHQFKLTGDVGKIQKIVIERRTQDNQTDTTFLASLAKEYGLIFSVRDRQFIFIDEADLEKVDSIMTLERSQIYKSNFRDKTSETFNSAAISKRNILSNEVVKWETAPNENEKKDTLVIDGRVEDVSQAQAKTAASLKNKNKEKITGYVAIPGDPALVAGVNIDLKDVGKFSGKWYIVSSVHTVDAHNGYMTTVRIRKII
jgi:phage protein D